MPKGPEMQPLGGLQQAADGGAVGSFAFGGDVDNFARDAIRQTVTGAVGTNPGVAAGMMQQNPALFGAQAQIFKPTELSSMLGNVGFGRAEQNPPMGSPDDKRDGGSQQPAPPPTNMWGTPPGYAEGGRVKNKKQEEMTKREFESVFDFLGEGELPPSRQRAEGIEGDLVFPQFSHAPPEIYRTPQATEGWRTAPPIAEPEGWRAAPPVAMPEPAPERGIYAQGGLVDQPGYYAAGGLSPASMRSYASTAHYSGANVKPAINPPGVHLISSSEVAGRTDRIPMRARTGSFVLPADVVSGLGQGNTNAGAKMWGQMISHSIGPMGIQNAIRQRTLRAPALRGFSSRSSGSKGFADGGEVDDLTPIVTAGGEALVDPEIVCALGGGDPDQGKKVLINSVMTVRGHTIKHLKKLPRPVP